MTQNLIRQADLDKFTPKGQCHEHWTGGGNGHSDYLGSHGNSLFLAESLGFLKGEMVLANYELCKGPVPRSELALQQRCVRA